MNPILAVVLIVVALAAGAAVGGLIAYKKGVNEGIERRKQQAEALIGSAEKEAERILSDADKDAESKKKGALIEAKDEIHKLRSEADKEIKDRRADLSRQERRVQQKEENLDRRKTASSTASQSLKMAVPSKVRMSFISAGILLR